MDMIDTNLLNLLLRQIAEEKGHVSAIWGIVFTGLLMSLPSILAYAKASSAEKSSKAAELTSKNNAIIALDTNRINKEQVQDLKEIHSAVTENKGVQEQIHQIVNSSRTALEVKIATQDERILDLEKRLSVALEKVEALLSAKLSDKQ